MSLNRSRTARVNGSPLLALVWSLRIVSVLIGSCGVLQNTRQRVGLGKNKARTPINSGRMRIEAENVAW